MAEIRLSKGCNQYGASMGRNNILPEDPKADIKLRMEALRWHGDYDNGGAYWGYTPGTRIYIAHADDVQVFVRASNRAEAKGIVRKSIPNARFWR